MKRVLQAALLAGAMVTTGAAQDGSPNASHATVEAALRAAGLAAPKPPETRQEMMVAMGYLISNKFKLFDANDDGALSPDEWLEQHFAAIAVFNEKRDGRITLDDFTNFLNGPPGQRNTVGLSPTSYVEKAFRSLDHGHKGYLTIEDFRKDAMSSFKAYDANRDGRVTKAEFTQPARRH